MGQTNQQRRLLRLADAMNRKAARLGTSGRITASDLAMVMLTYRVCPYCGIDLSDGGTFDHRIAFDRGGSNTRDNLVRCCYDCQRRKFTKTPEEWLVFRDEWRTCASCGKRFKPRFADLQRGYAVTCSRSCSGKRRWATDA